jgi:hypothetical protein
VDVWRLEPFVAEEEKPEPITDEDGRHETVTLADPGLAVLSLTNCWPQRSPADRTSATPNN